MHFLLVARVCRLSLKSHGRVSSHRYLAGVPQHASEAATFDLWPVRVLIWSIAQPQPSQLAADFNNSLDTEESWLHGHENFNHSDAVKQYAP